MNLKDSLKREAVDDELHAVGEDATCLFILFIETIGGEG